MAEEVAAPATEIADDDPEETPGYQPPKQKSLKEMQDLDQDDDSLVRYKQTLLAGVDPDAAPKDDPRRVVVKALSICIEGRDDVVLDLSGDVSKLKDVPVVIKEGVLYKIKVTFKVQHEIVAGLKYHHVLYRKGIRVDKQNLMVGSYGPKAEDQFYLSPSDEAPKGMISRGHYVVKSQFLDDDKNVYLAWEWSIDIKKDWE